MSTAQVLAVTPLNDLGLWARSSALEIVLIVLGAILLTRFVKWFSIQITHRIDERGTEADEVVRSEIAKHRHALAQVLTWTALVLVYSVAAILIIQRFGVPLAGFVAPATVVGVALGAAPHRKPLPDLPGRL
jgi:moderate conductance mechanosensitive channel